MRKEIKIKSTDKENNLHVYIWRGDDKPKAVVQISHGMTEYMPRYDALARYLVSCGYAVVGNDHLGHGYTAKDDNDLGYFGSGKNVTLVADLYEVTKYIRKEFGEEMPLFLIGHSMGSFLARQYIMTYTDEFKGVILSGTGYQPKPVLAAGLLLTKIIAAFKNERYRSKLLTGVAFGAYNGRIKNPRTVSDWLTKDTEIVDKYRADKYCTFTFTANGYNTLFNTIKFIQQRENISRISKSVPILLVSGSEDPVGSYGAGVKKVYETLVSLGVKDVSMKLYEGDRHEIFNELDKDRVMEDVRLWLDKILY